MKILHSAFTVALLAAGVLGTTPLTPQQVADDIKVEELRNVLWHLNKIGRDNGGNRAFGLPGFNASMDFILERAVKRFGKHMDTFVQPFTHLFQTTNKIWLTGPDGKKVDVASLMYNTATPLPKGVTAPLIDTPIDDTRGSACFEDQWKGIDATGKIALVKRGVCAISDKLKLARQHGALAVVVYNQTPGNISGATLSAENIGKIVPVGVIHLEDGQGWSKRLASGEKVQVTLLVDSIAEERPCWNIISETKEGDPNHVVMLGAHLDSVQPGPGVNDDGSGTAALLEIMGSLKKYKGFKNKVRFAWWGAEESGLIGSLYYTKQLSEAEADKIRFYFNYDMIGSPKPDFVVYANNDAHKVGGVILFDYLQSHGVEPFYGKFGSSSDYVGFLQLGIPSSGLFTGAGEPFDICYHQACDDINNIDWKAIEVNAKAAGFAAAKFALSLDGVPPRNKTTANPRNRREMSRSFDEWSSTAKVVEKQHTCGESGSNVV
ncbi:Peptide hydrolase [Tolypocladium paradoxum]|uniref:Peptide hydrolase n=1 Tax=Tolypocladium paradoxum TaxID=94208 RepID=A0A2S4KLP9_9HYPO|nr:Peptide hydrolase [Tolypocladium paradoxum]